MPKPLLLKRSTAARSRTARARSTSRPPRTCEAHIAFQASTSASLLEENGEYVDARRSRRRAPGCATAAGRRPRHHRRPAPGTSDLVAGWSMINIDSRERAVGLAAYVSSSRARAGSRCTWIDVQEVVWERPRTTRRGVIDEPTPTAGRGRAARPRPSGARGPGPAGRGASMPLRTRCRRRCWRRCGVARAPAARPRAWLATVATAAARRRPPQRGGPPPPRGGRARRAGSPPPPRRATTRSSCSSAAATPTRAASPRCALTLRAVGGLTTEIAGAFYVPGGDDGAAVEPRSAACGAPPGPAQRPRRRAPRALPRPRPAAQARWTWRARRSGSPASSPSPPRNRRRAGCSR